MCYRLIKNDVTVAEGKNNILRFLIKEMTPREIYEALRSTFYIEKEEIEKDEQVQYLLRLPSWLKERAELQALLKGLSLAGYIRNLIIKDLEKKVRGVR